MNCPYCGRAVDNTATMCPNCGGPLTPVELPQPEMPRSAGPDQPMPRVPDSSAGPQGALPLAGAPLPGPGAGTPQEPPPYQPPPYQPAPPGGASPVPAGTDQAWVPPSTPPPAPNRTPLIVGGVILAGIVALCCLGGAFLALGAFIATPTTRQVSVSPTPFVLTFPSLTVPTPGVADDTPPRMPLTEFKALYDDPDQRPLIIDVRTAETYSNGHIAGAISFPESDVDARIAELPKDKLIIAYCQ